MATILDEEQNIKEKYAESIQIIL